MRNNRFYPDLVRGCLMAVIVSIAAVIPVRGQNPTVREVIETSIRVEKFSPEALQLFEALPVESVSILTDKLNGVAPDWNDSRQFYLLARKVAQFEDSIPPAELDAAVRALSARLNAEPGMSPTDVSLLRAKSVWASGIRDRRLKEAVNSSRAALGDVPPPDGPREMKRERPSSPASAPEASSVLATNRGMQKEVVAKPEGLGAWWPLILLLLFSVAVVWQLAKRKKRDASGPGRF